MLFLSGCAVSDPVENALKESASQVNPVAQFDYAVFLLNKERYSEGRDLLLKSVEGGNEEALRYFGQHRSWIQTALDAEAGDFKKQRSLGIAYSNPSSPVSAEPQPTKAVKWLTRAVKLGDSISAFYLGGMFARGGVVEKDQRAATDWYLKAATLGNTDSMYILSMRYSTGEGVALNSERALYWKNLAAYSGHPLALENIAVDYSLGINGYQNDAWAVFWSSKLGKDEQLISNSLSNLPRLKPIYDKTMLEPTFTNTTSSMAEPVIMSRTTDLYALHYEGDWVEVYSPIHNMVGYVETANTIVVSAGRESSLKPSNYHLCEIYCQYGSCEQRNLDGSTSTFSLDINRVKMCQRVDYL
jgi:hypothetical protein